MPLEVQVLKTDPNHPRYVLTGHVDERTHVERAIGELLPGSVLRLETLSPRTPR